ncbi:MAG TPA: hypothetical protein VE961_01865, partial [Pyrinomonadaceae bacterium]|nr:hypothetical protein [Pyrinomonadaceae bacterium]
KLFLSAVLLTLVFHAGPLAAQERPAFRVIPIPQREDGYDNFESIAFNTKAEFESFLTGAAPQIGRTHPQAFIAELKKADIDFTREALVLLRHTESSGSVQVTFETPTLADRKLICQIRGKPVNGIGTGDMAYYCFAVVVSRALVGEVELRDVAGGFKSRELPPVIFRIRTGSLNQPGAGSAAGEIPPPDNKPAAIARLFGVVNELKSEPDATGAALLQSEVADVLWRFDEPGARVIFRTAFDSVRQIKANGSSLDEEAKAQALRDARGRANAIKTILKRYGLHDRKGAETWLQDLENDQQAEQKNSTSRSRMSLAQAELLAEIGAGLARQDAREALRLGLLSLNAESIPPGFTQLLMSLRSADKSLGDALFRQALATMRSNGLQYDNTLVGLTNYQFFANARPFPDATSEDVALITQYFVDAAAAQVAQLRGGPPGSDEQDSLGRLYGFLYSRALPIITLNSPAKLTLMQTNLAELERAVTAEQRQQVDTQASLTHDPSGPGDNDADIESRIRRAEQEKNADVRDLKFRTLAINLMRTQPEKALEIAHKVADLELRAQTEDDVYLVMMADAFRSGPDEVARGLALKINDKATGARWLAEIAARRSGSRSKSIDPANATAQLSEAYTLAMKTDNDAAKVDALLFIAQQFLKFDRDRGFEILSEAIKTANRVEPRPPAKIKAAPVSGVVTITVVNGKDRSTTLRPTMRLLDFNEVAEFAQTDYVQASGMGDSLKDHLLRAKYYIAVSRSILGVSREGPAYELSLEDVLRPN